MFFFVISVFLRFVHLAAWSVMCSSVQTQLRLMSLALLPDTCTGLGLWWVKILWIFLYSYSHELFCLFFHQSWVLRLAVLGGKVDMCAVFQTLPQRFSIRLCYFSLMLVVYVSFLRTVWPIFGIISLSLHFFFIVISLLWYLFLVSLCISLITNDDEHFFMSLLAPCLYSSMKCSLSLPLW